MRALPALYLLLAGCLTDSGPCADYCDYICECHDGEEGFDCAGCRTEYDAADPDLQDVCVTELEALESEDEESGHACSGGYDTAARRR